MNEELKPCPFCGKDASQDGRVTYSKNHEGWWEDGSRALEAFFVSCMGCGARCAGVFGGQQTRAKAVAAWNTRVPSPTTVEVSHETE